jgi:hypothetical protein
MTAALVLAGVYNLGWGAWAILAPVHSFAHSGMLDPDKPLYYPQLWQCIGMIVGVYGLGYILAARDPARHWPVVLVGLLGKVFGPVGLLYGVATGEGRVEGLITCIPNDLVWWVPFGLALRHAYLVNRGRA